MTTDEKLQHFLEFCMEDSRARSAKILDDYSSGLEKTFEEHKEAARHQADMRIQIEKDKIKREINKKIAIDQLEIRRKLSRKQEELRDMLFVELRNRLASFMETAEYQRLLEKQIEAAKKVAGGEHLIVYLDPTDEDKLRRISLHQGAGVEIHLNQNSFGGGTCAVIPSLNILIDNSFASRIEEAKRHVSFHLREKGGQGHD
ncbi:MAG TPA: V-type ATP synthase subunit E [Candidatus Lachnoclostridium pullistercoris]|uniref:V-type ATP synthase subunit E n=1 Tax=Candidatus Lachnoclostridium pullistercoris TaxID=2838632 RepID=A0A9D2PC62_9FIRM|nr:V-type ATP synthase subunit E [Candidatus Lachnoclostridium pullistercoris]